MRSTLRLAGIAVLLSAPAAALGCRCAERPLAHYFAAAETVAIGVLQQIDTGADETRLQFTLVDAAYKGQGASGASVTYTTGRTSAACGVSGEPGTVFVLFAAGGGAGAGAGADQRIDTCSGTRPLRIPGAPQPGGFTDVPVPFVVQQLLALAGLEVLRDSVHAAGSQPRLLGLLDIASLTHGAAPSIRAAPNAEAAVLERIDGIEQLYQREASYEFAAAEVYAREAFGYQVRLSDGRFGWLAAEHGGSWFAYDELPVNRLSYLTDAWPGFLWPEPGAGLPLRIVRQDHDTEIPVNTVRSARIGGSLWFYVERLDASPCSGGTPKVLDSGWLPAYGNGGEPTVWFYSRGC
ncbi:MAG: hypothetical protein V2J12_04010 [Gammaproteobacteria bacterium]|nr:hypothetical protein [Gammaproteobacteria bacterium]